jgi:hypothetical protein
MEKIKCPCCEQGIVEDWFDICGICGWEHDNLQYIKPDLSGGANKMSLKEAREAFKNGKEVK